MNTRVIDAGEFTLTNGIYHGRQHTFVTHRAPGKQWVSKDENEGNGMEFLATMINTSVVKFRPNAVVNSCDHRFWVEVKDPENVPNMFRSEFDALCATE